MFSVGADAYGEFMGRWSEPLAERFVRLADLRDGDRALDVGCGPGALTGRLVAVLGAHGVAAADPSEPFVAAVRDAYPGVDAHVGRAEELPFASGAFDATLAQLVVHFMADPGRGVGEMVRVTRAGGRVAACVWDNAGARGPSTLLWRAARDVAPGLTGEGRTTGTRDGELAALLRDAGVEGVHQEVLTVSRSFASVEDWWRPFTLGVGPAGSYVAGLDDVTREAVRVRCAELLPAAPFTLTASAWAAVGRVPESSSGRGTRLAGGR